jgi:putative DNA methylase
MYRGTEISIDPAPPSEADFVAKSLLDHGTLPVVDLAKIGLREGQSSLPIYRVHRWFARRLGSQFRALLTAAALPATASTNDFWELFEGTPDLSGKIILDPFAGGGTSLVEGARVGANVVCYEIDPVASMITSFELNATKLQPARLSYEQLTEDLTEFFSDYHTTLVQGVPHPVLYHFWVEVFTCAACGSMFDLHPTFQLARDAARQLQWVHCSSCDNVHELPLSRRTVSCACGTKTRIEQGNYVRGSCVCPACGHSEPHSVAGRATPHYRLFAQEYLAGAGADRRRVFKAAEGDDQARYQKAVDSLARFEREFGVVGPVRAIPTTGRSDARPMINGIVNYRQLFNDRQRLHLGVLAKRIAAEPDKALKKVLELAYSEHLTTNSMYTSYAAGYRRTSAMFAMHGFRHIVRPVEVNPWLAGEGRGTFPNVVKKVLRALDYAHAPYFYVRDGLSEPGKVQAKRSGSSRVYNKSSESMSEVGTQTVDLVLTDPPYFDNVSYSELSDFYLAWAQYLGAAPAGYRDATRCSPMEESLAVAASNEASRSKFAEQLARILREVHRVLKSGGRLVFTYHHSTSEAWLLLAKAIIAAGFSVVRAFPMRGEGQGGLHSYDGTIRWDAILVLQSGSTPRGSTLVSARSVLQATESVSTWWEDLSKHKAVGFRLPDARNFLRALLCASLTTDLDDPSTEKIELSEALDAAGKWEPPNGKTQ